MLTYLFLTNTCERGIVLIFHMETIETNAHKGNNTKTRTTTKTANYYSDMGTLHTFSPIIFTKKPLRYWVREMKASALMELIF